MNKRSGFTLVEAMVVIAIIGVLIAILIPSVQSVRESARRTTCAGNMRQVAQAMLAYENSRGYFPPQGWAPEVTPALLPAAGIPDPAGAYSFLFVMLPFVEQQGLYDSVISTVVSGSGAYAHAIPGLRRRVAAFECPSDPKAVALSTSSAAPTNYHAITSDQLTWSSATPNAYRCFYRENWSRSPFFRRASQVLDGLSNTIAIAEAATANGGTNWIGGIQMQVGGWSTTALPTVCLSQVAGGVLTNPQPVDATYIFVCTGMAWYRSEVAFTGLTTALPPNGPTCTSTGPNSFNVSILAYPAASSYHPAGVQVVMADGSVRFIDDTIDFDPNSASTTTLKAPSSRGLWGRLSTIAGSEMGVLP